MQHISIDDVIQFAIAIEQNGQNFYIQLARQFTRNTEVSAVFHQLAKDELEHEETFRQIQEEAGGAVVEDFERVAQLKAAASSEFFGKGGYPRFKEIESVQDALIAALNFEKSTLFYFKTVKDSFGPSKWIDRLIKEEKSHLSSLMKVIMTDAKFRSITDNF